LLTSDTYSVIRKTIRFSRKARQYLDAIDGIGAYSCILDEALKREVERTISIGGTKIVVRSNTPDLKVAISSLFEKEYENIRCANPRTIIDVGANIGTSAIYFAKKYPDAKIYAVEPENGNFDLLTRNTVNYENIIPVKAAIWGSADKRVIKNRDTGHWGYTISDTQNKVTSTGQEIDCVTISNFMSEYKISKIDILKMDIEGGEKDVLENSSEWIHSVDVITAELHDRICMGCDRAFYLATKDFSEFEKHGEKVTAYRF